MVLPGLWLADVFPDEEWDALGPDENGRGEATHPQFHLKLLLDRIGVARDEVRRWRWSGGGGLVAGARLARSPMRWRRRDFSHKWETLRPAERRLTRHSPRRASRSRGRGTGDRAGAARGAGNARQDRGAGHARSPARRRGCRRCSRAGASRPTTAPASRCRRPRRNAAARHRQRRRRRSWRRCRCWRCSSIRWSAARATSASPGSSTSARSISSCAGHGRPPGSPGSTLVSLEKDAMRGVGERARPVSSRSTAASRADPAVARWPDGWPSAADALAGDRAWRGPDGRMAAEMLAELQASESAAATVDVAAEDAVPAAAPAARRARGAAALWRASAHLHLGPARSAAAARRPASCSAGSTKACGRRCPRPTRGCRPRSAPTLGMPTLESRIGLAAHDFASALGRARSADYPRPARQPLADRRLALPAAARRDQRRPAARPRARAADPRARRSGAAAPGRPARAAPAAEQRPDRISVTAVDRLKADPFAFYAQAILKLRAIDPVDADHTARVEGRGGPQGVRGVARPRRVRSRQAAAARRAAARGTRRSIRCCAPCGRRGCSRRSTGSPTWSARTRRTGGGR